MIFFKSKNKRLQNDKGKLLENFPSNSSYAESYRTLRTNLFFSLTGKDLESVVVTSSVEGEGKTTTSTNLGYTVAQTSRKVLLVDLDLRNPQMSKLFHLEDAAGITDLISDVFGIHLTQGSLDTFSVNDLIQLARLQRMTCLLKLENEKIHVDILFEKGRIADIHWKNRPVSKKLANILIKNKILTEKEALQALAHQKKSVQRLGTILHTLGYVSKKDITKALTAHTVESVQAVSSMGKGEFAFFNQSSGNFKRSFGQYIDFEKLYNEFGVRHDQSHYLKNAIESAIQPSDDPNLFILPSGAVPSNPAEIIGSERSKFLIEYLTSLFDLIIIDTPPVMQATDALLAAPWTDGTILVIQSGRTEKKTIKEVLAYYKTARQPVLGTVLNRINSKSEGYYKYNTNYYPTYRGQ